MATVEDIQLSAESKQVIKDIVKSQDAGDKGYVTLDELADTLRALGFSPDDEDVEFLVKHMDDDGNGTLEVHEVIDNIDVINYHCFYGKALMQEFKNIDKDGDGVIRFPEMLKVLTTRGSSPLEPLPARQLLDKLARKFDANFDGKFSYMEFVKIYMSDILPYKDELESGTFKVEEYPQLEEEKKKKPVLKKKAKSTLDASKTKPATTEEKQPPSRSFSDLPGYMRPKNSPSSSAQPADNLPSYMRPKTGARASSTSGSVAGSKVGTYRPKTGASTKGSDSASGRTQTAARPRTEVDYDKLPGYMRPKTGAIRNGGTRAGVRDVR